MRKEQFIDQTLNGGYHLQRILDKGGYGSVFLARDNHDDSLVAVKLFGPFEKLDDANGMKREAQAQARLRHPNIVPYYWHDVQAVEEVIEDEEGKQQKVDFGYYPFIVMHYANEGSLIRYRDTKKGGKLDVATSVDVLVQASRGLQHAHDKKVLHRDVKPANILVDTANTEDRLDIMVTDFGVAVRAYTSRADKPASQEEPVGTTPYMAPEQFLPNGAIIPSDIYGLGIVAFELLTGRPPFVETDDDAYRMAHVSKPVPAFKDVPGSDMTLVLERLEEVVQKALAKNPEDRFGSMGDFGQELQDVYEAAKVDQAKARVIIDPQPAPPPEAKQEAPIELDKESLQEEIKVNEKKVLTDLTVAKDLAELSYRMSVVLAGENLSAQADVVEAQGDLYRLVAQMEGFEPDQDHVSSVIQYIADVLCEPFDEEAIRAYPVPALLMLYMRGIFHEAPFAAPHDPVIDGAFKGSQEDHRINSLNLYDGAIALNTAFAPAYFRKGILLHSMGEPIASEYVFQQGEDALGAHALVGFGGYERMKRTPEVQYAVELGRRVMDTCDGVKDNEMVTRLALEFKDKSKAEKHILRLNAEQHFYEAGKLALALGDKKTATRNIERLTNDGYFYQAGELAFLLGDEDYATKMLGRARYHRVDPYKNMSAISPFKFMYGDFDADQFTAYSLRESARGDLAVKLGDYDTVRQSITNLRGKSWYKRAAELALQIGDTATVQNMIELMVRMDMAVPAVEMAFRLGDTKTAKQIYSSFKGSEYSAATGNGTWTYQGLLDSGAGSPEDMRDVVLATNNILPSLAQAAIQQGNRDKAQRWLDYAHQYGHHMTAGKIGLVMGDPGAIYTSIGSLERSGVPYKVHQAGELSLAVLRRMKADHVQAA